MIDGNNRCCFITGLMNARIKPIMKAFVLITPFKLPVLPIKGEVIKLAAIHPRLVHKSRIRIYLGGF